MSPPCTRLCPTPTRSRSSPATASAKKSFRRGCAVIDKATRGVGRVAQADRAALGLRLLPQSQEDDGRGRLRARSRSSTRFTSARSVRRRCPDHIAVWDLLLPLRQRFQQYVNLRPMRLLPGLVSPLANRGPAEIDMICVRENSEGEYAGLGGRIHIGTPHEVAGTDGAVHPRRASNGFFVTGSRSRRSARASCSPARPKSNALRHSMVMWDEIAEVVRKDYPAVDYRKFHVDAIAARMVTHPASLDVIVASNLFGDILTDIGSAISGSLGIAPGANINPDRTYPSMFEPIHGSAPDIAGKGIANPIGCVWAGRDDARSPRASRHARSDLGALGACRRIGKEPDA